jgi:hypothetical protein
MELQRLCAYNQTRECFLGLEVAPADLSLAELKALLGKLALKSGEGLWMAPFRGIPDTNMRVPLDLLYLDEDCRVIETVESFPTFHATSSLQAASVLALPTHSIYSSQTQPGDQLVLCVAEEMQHRLDQFFSANSAAGGVQSSVLLKGKTPWSSASDVAESEDLSTRERPKSSPPKEIRPSQSKTENVSQSKSWLERWWSAGSRKAPELRKAPREPLPGLAAYYWTGAAPKAHSVRDISSTGLYVVTEERWYPGTLVLMTLQETDGEEEGAGRSISVHSRAVRWGNDGVGLQFIPQDAPEARKGLSELKHGVDKKELEQFLEQLLRKDNE